jgi:hypothetical protein
MVVIPVGDPAITGKVFVVEVAQPIIGVEPDGRTWNGKAIGGGVLIYSVDVNIPSGKEPIVVFPRNRNSDKEIEFGPLCKAPYQEGESFDRAEAPMTVQVVKKGRGYSENSMETDYEVVITKR